MNRLVRAELIRLRTVRMTFWLLLTVVAVDALVIFFTVPVQHDPNPDLSLDAPELLARCLGVGLAISQPVAMVLGILCFTQELRFGTITSTYLVTPRRRWVLAAKVAAVAAVGVGLAVAAVSVGTLVSAVMISARDGNVTWSTQFVQVAVAGFVAMVLYPVIGVALGALVRNQIGAVVGSIVWLMLLEQLPDQRFPAFGRWTPGGSSAGLLQLGDSATTHGQLLPAWLGGVVLAGYAVLLAAAAIAREPRHDIT
jgi:ABC-2 type transport system permease protein